MSGYPTVRTVHVDFGDHETVDAMAGLNPGHAMWRARQNWDGGTVTDLGPLDDAFIRGWNGWT